MQLCKVNSITKNNFTISAEIGFGVPPPLGSDTSARVGDRWPRREGGRDAVRPHRRSSACGTETRSRRRTPPHTPMVHGG